jgi:hypothetical protein
MKKPILIGPFVKKTLKTVHTFGDKSFKTNKSTEAMISATINNLDLFHVNKIGYFCCSIKLAVDQKN